MAGEVEAFLIAGPTASGKSALAVRLAEKTGGMVVKRQRKGGRGDWNNWDE